MSYIKKLLKLKNLSDLKFEGNVKLEGTGKMELSLKLKWGGDRQLFAGIRYGRGFRNLGEVRSGENVFSVEGEGDDFAVLVGDRRGPVAGCSTQNDLWSLYGYCDRLGEINEKPAAEDDPQKTKIDSVLPSGEVLRSGGKSFESNSAGQSAGIGESATAGEQPESAASAHKSFDLKEMGVTDVLILEDSTLGDDLDQFADAKENYYERARTELRENKMKEYFSKIESMLANNEREPRLENLFPSSRFVKIDFDGNGKYYVVGAVYEEDALRYLVYGVPFQTQDVPAKFVGVAQVVNAGDMGFLLLYQDAESGQMLTADSFEL